MQPRYGKRSAFPPTQRKPFQQVGLWAGLGEYLVHSLLRTLFYLYPFSLPTNSPLVSPKWGNQAVCSSAWSSYWQIKKLLLYAENPSPIIVVLFMYPKKLLRLNIGWKHKVSHQQSHPLKPIPQCFLSDFLQILKFVKQHRQYILRLPLKHSAYTQNISE